MIYESLEFVKSLAQYLTKGFPFVEKIGVNLERKVRCPYWYLSETMQGYIDMDAICMICNCSSCFVYKLIQVFVYKIPKT